MAHTKQFVGAGRPLNEATRAMIMLHGRGASAEDILGLRSELSVDDFHIIAPQATNNTWYPHSFLSPIQQNEPWLTSALNLINDIVLDINKGGISSDKIYFLGFSQGACLTLEFATRSAQKWGGIIAFTGGLIGDQLEAGNYKGDFKDTKVFIGNSDKDPHVPLTRCEESREVMENLRANVTLRIYPNMPHTINQNEIDLVNEMFFY